VCAELAYHMEDAPAVIFPTPRVGSPECPIRLIPGTWRGLDGGAHLSPEARGGIVDRAAPGEAHPEIDQ
jgi:hypothetical protein